MTMNNIIIQNIKVSQITLDQTINAIQDLLKTNQFHYIITLNPEILIRAQSLPKIKAIIQNATLCTADGVGIRLYSKLKKNITLPKVTGIQLTENLLKPYSLYSI